MTDAAGAVSQKSIPPEPRPLGHGPARRRPGILGWLLLAFAALLTIAILWLYFLDWNTMRGPLSRYASHRLGREVRIEGNLDVHLFSWTPSATVRDVRIANPDWVKTPLAGDFDRIAVSVRLWPLLGGHLVIPALEFDNPKILVERDVQGHTNWSFGGTQTGWKVPPIHRFIVRNGHLTINDHVRKMVFDGTVSSQEKAGAGNTAFQLTGAGTLNGSTFEAEVHGGSLLHIDESKPYHVTADIKSGKTHITADGQIDRPFHFDHLSAAVKLTGPNLADLYYLTGLAMPGTPPYALSAHLVRDGAVYRIENIDGTLGHSDLHGNLQVDSAQTPVFVSGTMASRVLVFTDLGPLIGAPAQNASGSKSSTASTSERAFPDTPLHVERIRQSNADIQYDADRVQSRDFPMRALHLHATVKGGVLTINPVSLDFSRGKLSAVFSLDARTDLPVTDVDARLSNLRLEQFVSGSPPPVEGLLAARAKLHGVGNSVHKVASSADGTAAIVIPTGKVRKAFAELTGINLLTGGFMLLTGDKSEAGLRCGVASFAARNGVMQAQRFIVDTDPVLIDGKGSIDLRNETLKLSLTGKPKEFRIGRLRAPILIQGTLSHPTIGVDAKDVITQGGLAVALGFLNPIAALLPFVGADLAKDANCTALSGQPARLYKPVKS